VPQVLCGQVGLLVLLVIDKNSCFFSQATSPFALTHFHVSVGRHHALHAAPQLVL
jgi:hypothetical protein